MKKILFALIVALVSLSASGITNWRAHRYEGFKALPTTSSDILFVGNSITHMHEWWEALGGNHSVKNRGVSGARVGETLDYIDGQMMGKPSKVFLGIGVNDVYGDKSLPAAGYVERLEKVVNHILWANPDVELIVSSVHPANRTSDVTFAQLAEMYKAVVDRKKAEGYKVSFVSTLEALAPIQSSNNTYTFDGLHLTAYGYKLWLNELKKAGHISAHAYESLDDAQMKSDIQSVLNVQGSSYGMRLTYLNQLPIKSDDIFVIGDEWVHSTEMHELVGSAKVKDRGTGWGYPGIELTGLAKHIPYILHGSTMPAQIWLATGEKDVANTSDNLETVKQRYQAVVSAIKAKAPNATIKYLSLLPTTDANKNTTRVKVFNEWLKTTYGADNYVDLYTTLEAGGVLATDCRYSNDNTLVGKGYIKIAEKLAPLCGGTPCMTLEQLADKEAKIAARKALTAVMDRLCLKYGTNPGEYPTSQKAVADAAIKAASAVLQTDATVEQLQAAKTTAEAEMAKIVANINQPTAGENVFYTICSTQRGNRYLTSNGTNLIGSGNAADANYASSQWKLVKRANGTYDIVNRADGKYLQTANYDQAIPVGTAAPADGWAFSDCNTAGLYNIQSGTCELNMTNTQVTGGYKVVNWSSSKTGGDKSDAGCQFALVQVEGDPLPEPEELTAGNYTIRAQFGDGTSATRYLVVNASGNLEATTTKPAADDTKAQWAYNGTSLQNVSNQKYLGVNKGFKLYTESHTLNVTDGVAASTKSIAEGNVNGAVKNDGTLEGGQFTGQKNNNFNGWTSDMVLEKVGGNTEPEGEGDEYIIDADHGTFTSSNGAKTWHSVWTSTKTPAVELTSGVNNMQYEGKNIKAETGNAGNCTYTIKAPSGYVIASYSFSFAAKDGSKTVKLTMDGKEYTTSATPQTLSAENVGQSTVSFTLNGSNGNSTILSNVKVTIEEADPANYIEHEVVMTRDNGVDYRIPAVAKNQAGDLIFVADYRYSGQDIGLANNGKLDLRYRIKRANGTWEPVKTLAKCIESPKFTAFGDPCIVADRESNRVMVTSCCGNVSFPGGTHDNHQGWARFYSENGGETWSEHTDISDQVFNQLDKRADGPIRCFFIGSGKISQSTRIKVKDYYRLYCAALVKTGDGTNVNYVFFSDDFGLNWTLLGDVDDCPIPAGGDEPKAEELPDGSIVISSRTGGRLFNVFHFTDIEKGLGKWGNATNSSTHNKGTFGAACNGEIMIVPVKRAEDGQKTYLALQSIPASGSRENVSIYYKELTDLNQYRTSGVFAPNWTKYQVSTMASGYSTMCLDKDNHVAFFFEEDFLNPGYKMVYCDLPIEKITNQKYSYCEISEAERKAYLSAGAPTYFSTQSYASEEPVASLVTAYVADPSDANYCALNAVLNEMVLPSANAQECPYASPAPVDGLFHAESKAYTMQIKGNIYITTSSMTEGAFDVNNTTVPTAEAGYWVIAGNVTDGYQIYNVGAGATKVLGVTGTEAAARTALYSVNDVPANVKTAFSYHANTYGGSTTGATFFIHGTDNNALNVRAPYFALWNSGNAFTDNGSRIELTKVEYNFGLVGVNAISQQQTAGKTYDLQGRACVRQSQSGLYIMNGRKVIK